METKREEIMNEQKIMWGIDDQEELSTEPEEVIESAYDDCETAKLPDTVRVDEYRLVTVGQRITEDVGANTIDLYKTLAEEYGHPEREPQTPSDTVKQKAEELTVAIIDDYIPYACERTGRYYEVNMQLWRKNDAEAFQWYDESRIKHLLSLDDKSLKGTK